MWIQKRLKSGKRKRKIVTWNTNLLPFFGNLRSFGIFIQPNVVVNLTSSIDIFLRSLGSTLFFCEWIFTASNNAWQPFSALSSSLPTRLGQSRMQIKKILSLDQKTSLGNLPLFRSPHFQVSLYKNSFRHICKGQKDVKNWFSQNLMSSGTSHT